MRASAVPTLHPSVLVIGRLPVFENFPLGVGQCHLARANQALQLRLNPVITPSAALPRPKLQLEVLELARVSAESERNDVIKFVLERLRMVAAGTLQKHLLYTMGEVSGWSYTFRVATHTDCLSNGLLSYIGVEGTAVVICCRHGEEQKRSPK